MKTMRKLFTKVGKLGCDDDRTEDYLIWDKLGVSSRFDAAWQLVVDAYKFQGKDLNELRFQRTAENIIRKQS